MLPNDRLGGGADEETAEPHLGPGRALDPGRSFGGNQSRGQQQIWIWKFLLPMHQLVTRPVKFPCSKLVCSITEKQLVIVSINCQAASPSSKIVPVVQK